MKHLLLLLPLAFGLTGASTQAHAQDGSGVVAPPKLGFNAVRVGGAKAQREGVPTGEGLKITYLTPGCPAASVLHKGDIVFRIGTWNVGNLADCNKALQAQFQRGQMASVGLVRGGQVLDVQAQVSDGWQDCKAGAQGDPVPMGMEAGEAVAVASRGDRERALLDADAEAAAMAGLAAAAPTAPATAGRPYNGVGPAPKIGFNANTVPVARARRMGVPTGRGIEITTLVPGCPASQILLPGDIVYRIGSRDVGTIVESNAVLQAQYSRGDVASVSVVRAGRSQHFEVQIVGDGFAECSAGAAEAETRLMADAAPAPVQSEALPPVRLGIGMAPHDLGVRITVVQPALPAHRAGLTVGDVVMTMDGVQPGSVRHAQDLVLAADRDLDLVVMRGTEVLTIRVSFGEGGAAEGSTHARSDAQAIADVEASMPELDEVMLRELQGQFGEVGGLQAAKEYTRMRRLMLEMAAGKAGPEQMAQLEEIRMRMGAIEAEARTLRGGSAAAIAAPAAEEPAPVEAALGVADAPPPAGPTAESPPPPAAIPPSNSVPSGATSAAASAPMAVVAASALVPVGGTGGAQALNYSCSSGRSGTVNAPVGQCQADRNAYAKAVACGERSEVKRTCEALHSCLGRSTADYCPY